MSFYGMRRRYGGGGAAATSSSQAQTIVPDPAQLHAALVNTISAGFTDPAMGWDGTTSLMPVDGVDMTAWGTTSQAESGSWMERTGLFGVQNKYVVAGVGALAAIGVGVYLSKKRR